MRQSAVFLMVIAVVAAAMVTTLSAQTSSSSTGTRMSRFLASATERGKKCTIDPKVCNAPGSPGADCCGDRCVNTNTDVFHCGKCGKVCKFTETCCQGRCFDLAFDKRHCGACFHRCPKGVRCVFGLCNYA